MLPSDPFMGPVEDPMLLPEIADDPDDPVPLPPNNPPESHHGTPVFVVDPV